MSQIQELIADYYRNIQHTGQREAAETTAEAIIEAVKTQDKLLAAWFPQTKHYFVTMEFGQPCAVLFSEQEIFEHFAESCKDRGIRTAAVESPVQQRSLLFADLWRCGITRVIIDFEPLYLNIALSDLFTPPDYSHIPLAQRPVLSPKMTGYVLQMTQGLHTGQANGNTELHMLTELYHSAFFSPVERTGQTKRIPAVSTPEGRQFAMLFTDRREWAEVMKTTQFVPEIVRYADMQQMLQNGCDGVVVNPGTGAELYLDAQLLEAAEKAAAGDTADLEPCAMQDIKIVITDPDEVPTELVNCLTAVLQNHAGIKTAWLRVMQRSDHLHARYLLIYEGTPETDKTAFFRELAKAAVPLTSGRDFECVSMEDLPDRSWIGKVPFYRKKRFGLLR